MLSPCAPTRPRGPALRICPGHRDLPATPTGRAGPGPALREGRRLCPPARGLPAPSGATLQMTSCTRWWQGSPQAAGGSRHGPLGVVRCGMLEAQVSRSCRSRPPKQAGDPHPVPGNPGRGRATRLPEQDRAIVTQVTLTEDTEQATGSPGGGREAARLYRECARLWDSQARPAGAVITARQTAARTRQGTVTRRPAGPLLPTVSRTTTAAQCPEGSSRAESARPSEPKGPGTDLSKPGPAGVERALPQAGWWQRPRGIREPINVTHCIKKRTAK